MTLQTLNDLATAETKRYLQRRADMHLEAAIGSLLDAYPLTEVIRRLETNAAHLREFG